MYNIKISKACLELYGKVVKVEMLELKFERSVESLRLSHFSVIPEVPLVPPKNPGHLRITVWNVL